MKTVRSTAISLFVVVLALFGVPSASAEPASGLPPQPAHLLAATYGGGLFHTIRGAYGEWTGFGDVFSQTSNPGYVYDTAAVMGANSELQVVAATDLGLFHTIRHLDGTWDPFRDVFGQTGSPGYVVDVAVANGAGATHLLVRTNMGGLFHAMRYTNGSWTAFGDVASQTGTAGYVTDVAGVGTTGGQLQILVANGYGRLYHAIRNSDGSWTRLGDVASQTGNPGRISRVAVGADVGVLQILVSTSDNGGVYHAIRFANGTWSAMGDVKSQTGNPGWVNDVAADCGINGELQIAVSVGEGGLFHAVRNVGGRWTPLANVKQMTGDPGSVSQVSIAG